MKNKLLLLFLVVFFIPFTSFSTHIVGGSLTYEQLGGSTYRITLKLYRDCKAGSAAFPNNVDISIVKNNGAAFMTVNIPFPGSATVPPNIDTCAVNPGICLEEAVYTKVVSGLPPSPGGYHVWWQYCCRNSTLLNIVSPLNAGETWYAHIPDNGVVITNSSPKWVNPPPVFVCQGNNMSVNHSATDADGDSLAYSLYTPYNGDTGAGALDPTYPGGVFTVPPVTWSSTYGANNPLNPAVPNSLTISPSGIINGIPPTIGQFVAGVRCEEWRNGVKIGEILRDFQFNVVNCPPLAVASFNSSGACNGLAISFTNTTTPAANNYFWDFGDGTVTTDTTSAFSPSYTYPALGVYTATLIINNGTPCADTSTQIVNLSYVDAGFSSDAPACKSTPVNFTDTSDVDPGSTITNWNWTFGDGFVSNSQNPTHPYNAGGSYTVTLITVTAAGCRDTVQNTVNIQGLPIANAGNDTSSCTNNPSVTLGGTVLNAGGPQWIGNGVFSNAFVNNPTYTPSASAIANGSDTLYLVTTSNALCPADTDQVIITFYNGPTVNAGSDLSVCKDTVSVPVCASVTVATGGMWQTMGSGTFTNASNACTQYIPSSADTTAGAVTVYITTTGNGNCFASSDTVNITFTSTPYATITSNDSTCASNPLNLGVNISTGSGVWSSSGTGVFVPADTALNGVYNPSPADDAAGNIILYFTSTNNGGCRATHDTIDVTIIPSPTAAYTSIPACPTFPVVFTDASTSTGTVVGWNWNFGDGSANSTSQNPTHPYNTGGPYVVTLITTSNNGCVDTLSQTVNVFYKPVAGFDANGICLKDGAQFTDTSSVTGSTISNWSWNFGDGSAVNTSQNPSHFYPSANNWNASLIVASAQGCIDTVSHTIIVLPGPGANFGVDDPTANVNQSVYFTDQSTNGAISWFWDFGDSNSDSTSTAQNPTHVYTVGGYYDVCLIATDMNGCNDTICKQEIISLPPAVPSGFTPNGDGENDVLYIYGGPFKTLEFKIYNNWGELIYISDKQSEGWDGKRKGIDQPIGVYVYTVYAVTDDGEEHHLSGDVTLLR